MARYRKKDEAEKQYMVRCRISGTATVFLCAKSKEEALERANGSFYDDSELDDWYVEEAQEAQINE
jgi:hypothetical protein